MNAIALFRLKCGERSEATSKDRRTQLSRRLTMLARRLVLARALLRPGWDRARGRREVLVATVNFVDPFDGQPITAGTTHVAESAAVALRFPERFRRSQKASGGAFARIGGAPALTGNGRSGSTTTAVPELFPEIEPSYEMEIATRVMNKIRRAVDDERYFEVAGWLFSRGDSIVLATPGEAVNPSSAWLDPNEWDVVRRMAPDLCPAGDFHSHPSGDLLPSERDLKAWSQGAKLAGGFWFGLILGPSKDMWSKPSCAPGSPPQTAACRSLSHCGWRSVNAATETTRPTAERSGDRVGALHRGIQTRCSSPADFKVAAAAHRPSDRSGLPGVLPRASETRGGERRWLRSTLIRMRGGNSIPS
jgi:proteasome lid subunit RPN8/RPN11